MPTYFQIGRNSIEASESLYVPDPRNKGLVGMSLGKRQNIPIAANILSKSDSAERLNLRSGKNDSPSRRFAAKLKIEERNFRQLFEA